MPCFINKRINPPAKTVFPLFGVKDPISSCGFILRLLPDNARPYLITKIGVLAWKIIFRAILGLKSRAKIFLR